MRTLKHFFIVTLFAFLLVPVAHAQTSSTAGTSGGSTCEELDENGEPVEEVDCQDVLDIMAGARQHPFLGAVYGHVDEDFEADSCGEAMSAAMRAKPKLDLAAQLLAEVKVPQGATIIARYRHWNAGCLGLPPAHLGKAYYIGNFYIVYEK